jgi:cell shape-determining protein MreC
VRTSRQSPSPRALLGVALLTLLVLALAPTQLTRWVTNFRGPIEVVIAPGKVLFSQASRVLRPPLTSPEIERDEQELREQYDELLRLHLQSVRENRELREVIRSLQAGTPYPSSINATRLSTQRQGINLSTGLVQVRGGSRDGVVTGSVAVAAASQQLIGIVAATDIATSSVRLITDARMQPNLIGAIVTPPISEDSLPDPERSSVQVTVELRATGDGTLRSEPIGATGKPEGVLVPGGVVLLRDPTWPDTAQFFTIGLVETVEDLTRNPGFVRITVRPTGPELGRVGSMILHIPGDQDPGGAR